MEKQKFYLIFLICLIFIGFNAYKLGDFKLQSNAGENDMLSEASMSYAEKPSNENKNSGGNSSIVDEKRELAPDARDIQVNRPTALSGKSKSEIYNLRKAYVKNSIFARTGYEPSEAVFGGIESGKPWISADVCVDPSIGLQRITGPSEEARFINNPTILVALEYPYIVRYTDPDICASDRSEMIPQRITYSPSKKEITVTYYNLPFTTNNNPSFYMFNGVNARDLGYKYAYVDNSKSTYKVNFVNSDNISTGVKEFQNFIHLGGSCGHDGGCNNGSPRQPFLEFKSNETSYSAKNREIYIKLWKSMPNSPASMPDIVERIILKWS